MPIIEIVKILFCFIIGAVIYFIYRNKMKKVENIDEVAQRLFKSLCYNSNLITVGVCKKDKDMFLIVYIQKDKQFYVPELFEGYHVKVIESEISRPA